MTIHANPLARLFALALTVTAFALPWSPSAQAQTAARSKVVFQVSDADPAKWNLTLNNVKNVQTDLGAANVDIEIVAYGPGLGMLKADSLAGNRVAEAFRARVAPTVLLISRSGELLAEPLVGASIPEFYGAYLTEWIETAKRKLAAG